MSDDSFVNPYSEGTQKYKAIEVLRDCRWHCAKCELPGSQPAKMLQGLRQDGWQFEKKGDNWESRLHCEQCGGKTSHRRLSSLERQIMTGARAQMPALVRERIRTYYRNVDEILGYSPTGRTLEVDHRIPQVRWTQDEEVIPKMISNQDIESRFMLLTREHNLLKSRSCERCVRIGKRQPFLDVGFFYEGSSEWNEAQGCVGCGWHHPAKWRAALNAKLQAIRE